MKNETSKNISMKFNGRRDRSDELKPEVDVEMNKQRVFNYYQKIKAERKINQDLMIDDKVDKGETKCNLETVTTRKDGTNKGIMNGVKTVNSIGCYYQQGTKVLIWMIKSSIEYT
ncbi:hypothetical protein F8M41_022853 [Gigaspora margarita]|uniref:Uncharacterized protein n=1 Tax=Gigaspora margarita TaxID=4874 RepID=A0A8H4AEF1_GIGMA|nr:hypothetical protein F8M41_022853 [Gigaspora margarita]